MNRIILLIFLFCFSCNESKKGGNSQNNGVDSVIEIVDAESLNASVKADEYYENMKSDSEKISQFVPVGYKILDTIRGDLNKDEFVDMVLVLRSESESAQDTIQSSRPLLLLVGNDEGNFRQVARNDNTIYCSTCGGAMGDPYQGIVIKSGNFSVEHYGGRGHRWERIVTYKYSTRDNTWYLFRDGHVSFHAADPENSVEKVYTQTDFGMVKFEQFNIYKDQ